MGARTAKSTRRALHARLAEERGITIVEVMVAALILTISALALLSISDAASRNTYRAEQSQVVVNRLQAELEQIRQLPYSEVALATAPPTSSDSSLPASRVSGAGAHFALARDGGTTAPLSINGGTSPSGTTVSGGMVEPGPEEFTSGDVSGQIYRYVVYPGVPANCAGCNADDLKRVIVAITLDDTASGGERAYQEVQSEVANPDATPPDNELPPPDGSDSDSAAFWLTDTPCNQTTRQPLTGHHNTHNTRGHCGNPVSLGESDGPPDLMFNEPPPSEDAGTDPFYDYAADVEPDNPTEADVGLTIREPKDTSTCFLQTPLLGGQLDFPGSLPAGGEQVKQQKMHMWLSNELTPDFRLLTTGSASLNLWTKTINSQPYAGKICIWLFKRVTVLNLLGQTITVDVPALNLQPPLLSVARFEFQRSFWPQDWTEIRVPMRFIWATDALSSITGTILGQPRLGLAMTVEKLGTAGAGLEFNYDHRERDSRLEVQNDQGLVLFGN